MLTNSPRQATSSESVETPPASTSEKTKAVSTILLDQEVKSQIRELDHVGEARETVREMSRHVSSGSLSIPEIRSWNCVRQGCILAQLKTHPRFQDENAPPAAGLDKHREITLRSVDLGMQAPDRHLTARIAAKFPDHWSGETIAQKLARFPGQQGPGLWAMKTRAELEFEAARQSVLSAWSTMSEKEAQRAAKWERLERLAQMADEEEEQRRRSAAND